MGNDDRRPAWSAAWGVTAVILGGGAAAAWIAALQPHSGIPRWVAFLISGLTAATLYLCFGSLAGWWPWRSRYTLVSTGTPDSEGVPQAVPLVVQITDCRRFGWITDGWVFYAIRVQIRNRSNQVILITEIDCKVENDAAPPSSKRPNDRSPVGFKEYKPQFPDHFRLRPVKTISGWVVGSAPDDRSYLQSKVSLTVTLTDEYLRSYTAVRDMTVVNPRR